MIRAARNVEYLFLLFSIFIFSSCATGQKYVIKEVEITEEKESPVKIVPLEPNYFFVRKESDIVFNLRIDTNQVCDTRGKIVQQGDSCKVFFNDSDCRFAYTHIMSKEINIFRGFWGKTGKCEQTENGFNIFYSRKNVNYRFTFIESVE